LIRTHSDGESGCLHVARDPGATCRCRPAAPTKPAATGRTSPRPPTGNQRHMKTTDHSRSTLPDARQSDPSQNSTHRRQRSLPLPPTFASPRIRPTRESGPQNKRPPDATPSVTGSANAGRRPPRIPPPKASVETTRRAPRRHRVPPRRQPSPPTGSSIAKPTPIRRRHCRPPRAAPLAPRPALSPHWSDAKDAMGTEHATIPRYSLATIPARDGQPSVATIPSAWQIDRHLSRPTNSPGSLRAKTHKDRGPTRLASSSPRSKKDSHSTRIHPSTRLILPNRTHPVTGKSRITALRPRTNTIAWPNVFQGRAGKAVGAFIENENHPRFLRWISPDQHPQIRPDLLNPPCHFGAAPRTRNPHVETSLSEDFRQTSAVPERRVGVTESHL